MHALIEWVKHLKFIVKYVFKFYLLFTKITFQYKFIELKYLVVILSVNTLYLSEFDYQISHIKGNDKNVADGLSRLLNNDCVQVQTNELDYVNFMGNTMPIDYKILRVGRLVLKKIRNFN